MKFYGVRMFGKLQVQSYANIAAAGAATDEGRVVYIEADESLYVATGAAWRKSGIAPELYDANTILKADTDNAPSAMAITEQTVVGRLTGGVIKALSTTELTTLVNVATSAAKGASTLATSAEVIAGVETLKTITPATLTSKLDTDGTLAGNLDTRIATQKATKTYVDSVHTTITNNYFAPGTKLWFYQNAAPTGWTIDASAADSLIGVKGGTQAYNTTGGQVVGTWTQPGHTHTGPSHTHTGPSHTHTGPSHVHSGPSHTHIMTAHEHGILSHTHTGPSHSHTGAAHTHTTSAHTLTTAEMPAHAHMRIYAGRQADHVGSGAVIFEGDGAAYTPGSPWVPPAGNDPYYDNPLTGGGGSHTHGDTGAASYTTESGLAGTGVTGAGGNGSTSTAAITFYTSADGTQDTGAAGTGETGAAGTGATGADGTGATSASNTAATYRPYTSLGIIATKN